MQAIIAGWQDSPRNARGSGIGDEAAARSRT